MIGRFRRRYGYTLAVISLLGCIVAAGGFIVLVALPDLARTSASPGASPGASASPSPAAPFMAWLAIPADADCSACHLTDNGAIGLRAVPAMAHPLSGWTNCTSCHADDRLVATAPGHVGIHKTDCLLCHQPAQLPPPLSRPHRELQNQECLTCHGQADAPLPADMAHRPETVCWLCHRVAQEQPPVPAHQVSVGQSDCLSCHVGGVVGALPEDHATREASECLLCHAPPPSSAPQSRTVQYPLSIRRLAL